FIRLGVLGDWENPYLTMDFRVEADIVRALGRIIQNGHLQKGYKPVHWCLDCASALAEALLESCMTRYQLSEYKIMGKCKGRELEGLLLQHPFYNRQVPIILGEHVTTEAGTGAVHTAPGHGQEDYAAGLAYKLPVDNPVDARGVFVPGTDKLAGIHVYKANDVIIELLSERGTLLHKGTLQHSYPHCWRHKTPIIFRATPQWFISMEQKNLRVQALQAIDATQWLPDWGKARIHGMVANRPDWCISRQRTWGVPITLFAHKQTEELHPDTPRLIEQVAQRIEQGGIDAWYDLDPAAVLGKDAGDYIKVNDTLDVWFDSGVTHFAVLEQRAAELAPPPADLYLEGSDQHRGWFQSSLLTGVGIHAQAPYKAVLTHGFTVDAQGRKMSKSLGNVVAPQQVLKTLGADILRLWVAATDYSGEMSVSDEILNRMADSYRRIRNTLRFLLANLDGFDPAVHLVPNTKMIALDRWAVSQAGKLQQQIIQAYEQYQFHRIYQLVHNFCIVDLGGFYLDVIKDRQYTTPTDGLPRRSAQTALYHIVEAMVRWLAPILSFTADEVWGYIPGKRGATVFTEQWYGTLVSLSENESMNHAFWNTVIEIRQAVSKQLEILRVSGGIGSSLAAEVDLYCEPEIAQQLAKLGDELRFALITSYARVHAAAAAPPEAVKASLEQQGNKGNISIRVTPSAHAKCVRCWHYRGDVGKSTQHPELCGRCVENVEGQGETRNWA
ncbi:MAG TPA: class I tRNA ligase family protein, partial [Gammaproteobacteria bacterium]